MGASDWPFSEVAPDFSQLSRQYQDEISREIFYDALLAASNSASDPLLAAPRLESPAFKQTSSAVKAELKTAAAAARRQSRNKRSRLYLRAMLLVGCAFFAATAVGTAVTWQASGTLAGVILALLVCSFLLFEQLEKQLRSSRLPQFLAHSAPLIPSVLPPIFTLLFFALHSYAFGNSHVLGSTAPVKGPQAISNNFTGVTLCLYTLFKQCLAWITQRFELPAGGSSLPLPRQMILQIVQPQLLQQCSFSFVIALLLIRHGEQQLAGLLLSLVSALVRTLLLQQQLEATMSVASNVTGPIWETIKENPAIIDKFIRSPQTLVAAISSLSAGAVQRLLLVALLGVLLLHHFFQVLKLAALVLDLCTQSRRNSVSSQLLSKQFFRESLHDSLASKETQASLDACSSE